MQNNTAFKSAPAKTDDKKIDVTLKNGEAEIKLSTWTEDLGWCCQKTMSLDIEKLDELQGLITEARVKLQREADEANDDILSAAILEFRTFA